MSVPSRRRRRSRRMPLSPRGLLVLALLLPGAGLAGFFLLRPREEAPARFDRLLSRADRAVAAGEYARARELLAPCLAARPRDPRALYLEGRCLAGLGRREEGLGRIREALRLRGDLPGARLFLARELASRGEYRRALEEARLAPEAGAHLVRARVLAVLGREEEASEAYARATAGGEADLRVLGEAFDLERRLAARETAAGGLHGGRLADLFARIRRRAALRLEDHPEDARTLLLLARVEEAAGILDPGEVRKRFEAARRAAPGDAEVLARFAAFLSRAGERDEARARFEEALREHPSPGLSIAFAAFREAAGEVEEGIGVLGRALAARPGDAGLRAALVRALLRAGRAEEALRTAEAAPEGAAGDPILREAAGDAALAAGDREAAEAAWREALRKRPGDLALLRKTIRPWVPDLARGDRAPGTVRAGRRLAELRERNPWDRDGLLWAAEAARGNGREGLALNLLSRLLDLRPEDLPARILRGRILLARGRTDDALRDLLRVVRSGRAPPDVILSFARAALPAGRNAEAAAACERGLAASPGSVPLHAALGRALLALGREGEFLRRLDRAPEAVRRDPEVRVLRARALARTGRAEEGERILLDLLGEDPGRARAYADFLFALGRREEAERFLREANRTPLALARWLVEKGARASARTLLTRLLEENDSAPWAPAARKLLAELKHR